MKSNNEFVIFDCFKNMLNKNKDKNAKSMTGFYNNNQLNLNEHRSNNQKLFTSHVNLLPNNNESITNSNKEEFGIGMSMIKDLDEFDNNNNRKENDIYTHRNNIHHIDNDYNIVDNENEKYNNLNHLDNDKKCNKSYCIYYKKKYKFYKKNYDEIRLKLKKEKKITEMLNLKLFYENNKHLLTSNYDRLNSTNISSHKHTEEKDKDRDNELRITRSIYEKLEENMILFEKLENEIINKDLIISKQNDSIKHQKLTIDNLLEHFNVFLNQGNYLINDLLILKQNLYDKNFKEVTKDFEEISSTINDYTSKIKDFTDKTKNLVNDNPKYQTITEIDGEKSISFNLTKTHRQSFIMNKTSHFEDKVDDNNDDCDDNDNHTHNNLSFTRSHNHYNHLNEEDKTLKMLDLSNNNHINMNSNDLITTSQFDEIDKNFLNTDRNGKSGLKSNSVIKSNKFENYDEEVEDILNA